MSVGQDAVAYLEDFGGGEKRGREREREYKERKGFTLGPLGPSRTAQTYIPPILQ